MRNYRREVNEKVLGNEKRSDFVCGNCIKTYEGI
jgi:hypothetical protein